MTDSTGNNGAATPDFRYAPSGWSKLSAESEASAAGLTPVAEHWEAVNALQEFFSAMMNPASMRASCVMRWKKNSIPGVV